MDITSVICYVLKKETHLIGAHEVFVGMGLRERMARVVMELRALAGLAITLLPDFEGSYKRPIRPLDEGGSWYRVATWGCVEEVSYSGGKVAKEKSQGLGGWIVVRVENKSFKNKCF